MKLLKNVVIGALLSFALSAFYSPAMACEDGRKCVPFLQAIKIIDEHIDMAISSIEESADPKVILSHIKQAKDTSKEINENDKVDIARGRANGALKKAKSAVKKGNIGKAKKLLEDAKKRFSKLDVLRN